METIFWKEKVTEREKEREWERERERWREKDISLRTWSTKQFCAKAEDNLLICPANQPSKPTTQATTACAIIPPWKSKRSKETGPSHGNLGYNCGEEEEKRFPSMCLISVACVLFLRCWEGKQYWLGEPQWRGCNEWGYLVLGWALKCTLQSVAMKDRSTSSN